MFSAVIRAVGSSTSSTPSGPSQASRICSASVTPPTGDQPLKMTARGGLSTASREASCNAATQRGLSS